MARIIEQTITVNLSKLVKGRPDSEDYDDEVIDDEMLTNISDVLEGAIVELINDPSVIVEVKTTEKY